MRLGPAGLFPLGQVGPFVLWSGDMNELNGQGSELRFTIEVRRAATGKTETCELIGKIGEGENNGGHSQHGGKKRRD